MMAFATTKQLFAGPVGGGAEATLKALALRQADSAGGALALCRSATGPSETVPDQLRLRRLPFLPGRGRWPALSRLDDAVFLWWLRRLVARQDVRQLVFFFEQALLDPLLRLKQHCPEVDLVLRIAGPSWVEKVGHKAGRKRKYKRLFEGVDRINCLSPFQARQFQAHCAELGIEIPSAKIFVADALSAPEAAGRWTLRDPASLAVPRLVMAGRLTPYQKRQDILIRAVARIGGDLAPGLTLFGQGAREGALRALAQSEAVADRVQFAGLVERRAFQDQLSKCDLFCLTTDYEGTSKALLEAMAIGIPCLVSDVEPMTTDLAELAQEGGVILVENTPEAWATAIQAILQNPVRVQEMSRKAQSYVSRTFTSDAAFAVFLNGIAGRTK